jgi:hypothetical protein
MRSRGSFLTIGAAAALIAALIGAAAAQEPPKLQPVAPQPAAQRPAPPQPAQPPKRASGIPELPPIEDLEATVERPLFTRTRRPPQAPEPAAVTEAAPVAVPSEESPADLTGIVNGPGLTYAILTNKTTKETVHLRQGETIENWSIREIGPRYVVLARGPGSLRLELFEEKEPGKSAATDGDERLQRLPANMRPRFAPQVQQRQRQRPARQPARRQRPE